jgi:GTP-binding protein
MADYRSLVVADIPGLIEGAHRGVGLGFQFLRHVERTSMLLHLVDISEMAQGDPVDNFEMIMRELELYSPDLVKKPQAAAGTKTDVAGNKERLEKIKQYCDERGIDFLTVSAATGEGISQLISYLAGRVRQIKEKK